MANDYSDFFRNVVLNAWFYDVQQPLEGLACALGWIEYLGQEIKPEYVAEFLLDAYGTVVMEKPKCADDLFDWIDNSFSGNPATFRPYWSAVEERITKEWQS